MLKSFIPALEWGSKYQKKDLKGDISAGLTVGVMLIPQGMAYAMLAGMPPIYGLYASTIPLIIYAFLGTSRQLAIGPAAMVAILIASGVSELAAEGSDAYIAYAILLALMVGVLQFSLGLFKLGFLVNFLSHPVISGFTSAAAFIIGFSQLKYLLGIDIPRSNYIHEIILDAYEGIGAMHFPTLVLGVTAIAVIILLKKWNKSIPGSLIVVILGILVVYGFGLDEQGVQIVKNVPEGLPNIVAPQFSMEAIKTLIPIALTIGFVGFMESIAVAKAIQSKHKDYKIVPNQELIALGAANIIGSFFQSFPTTGGFGRSAVNDQAGARTGLASILSALLIIMTLLFLTPLFYYLPKAILASIIMVAVAGLIDTKEMRHLWHTDRKDFYMLMITFLATLIIGIEEGILVGVILSLAMVIWRVTYPHVAPLGRIQGTNQYRNLYRFPDAEHSEEMVIVRFDAQLFFANISYLLKKLEHFEEERYGKLKVVILNAKSINGMDSSAVHALKDLAEEYKSKGIEFYFTGVKGPVRDVMVRGGLVDLIGRENFFTNVHEAVLFYTGKDNDRLAEEIVLQTNHP